MDSKKKKELELWAAKIRKTALQTIQTAGSGHIGGSFSICDIMSVLYFDKMNVDPANPDKPDRDRLVLSKGHCSPAMYATLALKGFFPVEHLSTFRKLDSDLSGHSYPSSAAEFCLHMENLAVQSAELSVSRLPESIPWQNHSLWSRY